VRAPHQVQQGSGEGSGEGLGGFGAEAGEVQQGSGEGSGGGSREGLGGFGAETGQVPAKVPVKVWKALVQRFRRSGRLGCKARSSSTGLRRSAKQFRTMSGTQVQQGSGEGC